jgi:acetylornithine/N-succinyldiaminopimelate aminotransferase
VISERQLFLQHVAQTSATPLLLDIERAEGIYLYDKQGNKLIDLIAGISVSNLGHCNPAIIDAIHIQSKKYAHVMVNGEYIQSPQVQLAKKLSDLLPSSLNNIYYTTSGSEATEGAMKLAKRYTGRTQIISFKSSYHGSTQGSLSIMGDEYFKQAFRPLLPYTLQIRYGNLQDLNFITQKTAAIFIEPVQAEAGVNFIGKEYLKAVRDRCNNTGTLLVLDEIQTGFGRTGSLFAFEQLNFVPDVMLIGKAFGAGLPLAAFISSKEIMSSLINNPVLGHINTFGGNAICCAASLAGLNVLLNSNYIQSIKAKEKIFRSHLIHSNIKSVKSLGLLIAVEFEDDAFCQRVIRKCIEKGIVTDWFLFAANCLRIAPPLIITEEEIIMSCKMIVESIEEISK